MKWFEACRRASTDVMAAFSILRFYIRSEITISGKYTSFDALISFASWNQKLFNWKCIKWGWCISHEMMSLMKDTKMPLRSSCLGPKIDKHFIKIMYASDIFFFLFSPEIHEMNMYRNDCHEHTIWFMLGSELNIYRMISKSSDNQTHSNAYTHIHSDTNTVDLI